MTLLDAMNNLNYDALVLAGASRRRTAIEIACRIDDTMQRWQIARKRADNVKQFLSKTWQAAKPH
jgi:hypothetical protein